MVVVASAAATSLRLPIDFWLLVKAGMQPEEADVELCGECIRGVKQKDETALRQSLAELTARPIAVEFKPLEDELPEDQQEFLELNAELAEKWLNITEKKDALPDAEEWADKTHKLQHLER